MAPYLPPTLRSRQVAPFLHSRPNADQIVMETDTSISFPSFHLVIVFLSSAPFSGLSLCDISFYFSFSMRRYAERCMKADA